MDKYFLHNFRLVYLVMKLEVGCLSDEQPMLGLDVQVLSLLLSPAPRRVQNCYVKLIKRCGSWTGFKLCTLIAFFRSSHLLLPHFFLNHESHCISCRPRSLPLALGRSMDFTPCEPHFPSNSSQPFQKSNLTNSPSRR